MPQFTFLGGELEDPSVDFGRQGQLLPVAVSAALVDVGLEPDSPVACAEVVAAVEALGIGLQVHAAG
jgi:hypothetical protein